MAVPHPRAPRPERTQRPTTQRPTSLRSTTPRPDAAAPRLRRRVGRPAGAVLLLAGMLAACAGGSGSAGAIALDGGASAAVAAQADCLAPQVLTALGFDPAAYPGGVHPDVPAPAPLPAGFTSVSAVLCSTGETLTDGAGRWAAVTATRLEGDVAPLVAAVTDIALVPAARSGTCAPTEHRSDLWLVDALGSAVRVALPGGGCGPLPADVTAGIVALDAVDVEHYPVALVAPSPSPSAG